MYTRINVNPIRAPYCAQRAVIPLKNVPPVRIRVPLTGAFNFHGIDKSVELQIQIPGTCVKYAGILFAPIHL